MKYRIVQEWDREILARAVQQWIDEGWMPQGGVAVEGVQRLLWVRRWAK